MSQQVRRSTRKSQPVSGPSVTGLTGRKDLDSSSSSTPTTVDYSRLSAGEIMNAILERNKDPEIERMVLALIPKIPQEVADTMESEKRARSLVVHNLVEAPADLPPSHKQRDLEDKVNHLLDLLDVECRPVEVYRMGKMGHGRPRLVKIVLPSRSHWKKALANSYKLPNTELSSVRVRRSMTPLEMQHEKDLRNEARERNDQLKKRVWVVYRGELRRAQDLPNVLRPGGPVSA